MTFCGATVTTILSFILVSSEIEFDDDDRYIAVWDDTGYVSWQDALQYCIDEMGTMLASIHNDSDHESLLFAAIGTGANVSINSSFTSSDYIWIGLNDTNDEGNFDWVDGSSLDYTNWAPSEPGSGGAIRDCVDIENALWYDRVCDGSVSQQTTVWVCNRPYGKP